MPTMKTQQLQQHQKQASAAPLRVVTVYRHVPGRDAHPVDFRKSLPLIGRLSFDRVAPTLSRLERLVHRVTAVPPPQLLFYVHFPLTSSRGATVYSPPVLVEDDVFYEDEEEGATRRSLRRRRRAPYVMTVEQSFSVVHWQDEGMLECILFVRFAGDFHTYYTTHSFGSGKDSSSSPLVTWPSGTKFDLPLHITVMLRTTSNMADLTTTIDISAQTGRVWELKLAVERITGVPPSRQSLEYHCQPVEMFFRDIIHDPSSQYGIIDGVLLRDVIQRDPTESPNAEKDGSRDKLELRACCAEIPYQLFIRFLDPLPHRTVPPPQQDHTICTSSVTGDKAPKENPSPSLPQQQQQQQLFCPVQHESTTQWERAPGDVNQQNHSCRSNNFTNHNQSAQGHRQQQHNTQSSSMHPPLKKIRRKKKQQQQVDVIEIDLDEEDSNQVKNEDEGKSDKMQEEDNRKDASRKGSNTRLPDPNRCRIKIKNLNIIMKNNKSGTCSTTSSGIDQQSAQPSRQRGRNNKGSVTAERNSGIVKSSSSSSSKSRKGPTSSTLRRSRTVNPNNPWRAKRAAPPTLEPISDEGHIKRSRGDRRLSSPSSSSGMSSSSLLRRQSSSPHHTQNTRPSPSSSSSEVSSSSSHDQHSLHLQPPNNVWQWLHTIDAEGGGRGGRILRHAGAFVREFPCLEDVVSACDMEGPDRVLDACGVMAMGERACLKRAMKALRRP